MTYDDLQTDAERDIWRAEMLALGRSPQAEHWATHAVNRHRECHSGPLENSRIRRRSIAIKRIPLNGHQLVNQAMEAGRLALASTVSNGMSARSRMLARGVARAFAFLAVQLTLGTPVASKLLGISEQGIRNRSVYLRTDHPDVADKARAFSSTLVVEWATETERGP
jgi:hypothetical protein